MNDFRSKDNFFIIEELLRKDKLLEENQNLYDPESTSLVHHVNQALLAHKLFTKNKEYVVKSDDIILIDEFTGRMMQGRRLSDGLHQAIEAKEGVAIQPENITLASVTFQNYFRNSFRHFSTPHRSPVYPSSIISNSLCFKVL